MERYDAILEQLRKAQSRGIETITNRLDFVVQSLEELINDAKSSVQGAMPESADELFPVDEVEASLDSYRQQAEAHQQRCAELESKIEVLGQAAVSQPQGASITLMRALDKARSQSELLKELLPAISENAARAVVLVLREGKVSAWSGIGFADGEVLRSWQGDVAESEALSKLLESPRPICFTPAQDDLFRGWFADEVEPNEILLIPVVLRGKLMGTVYIDRLDGQPWDPDTAQTLVAQVCWLIDTLQYRHTAAPSLAEPVNLGQIVAAVAPEPPPMAEKSEPESDAEADGPEVVDDPEPVEAVTQETVDAGPVDRETEEPEIDPSATMKIDVSGFGGSEAASDNEVVTEAVAEIERQAEIITAGHGSEESTLAEVEDSIDTEGFDPAAIADSESTFEPEPAIEPEFEPEPEPEFEPEPEPEPDESDDEIGAEKSAVEAAAPAVSFASPNHVQMPVTPPEPMGSVSSGSRFLDEPPPVQPVQPPPAEPEMEVSEDEAQREEARRFARLLVSEIKLYNEEQVERGRESGDIYSRLKEDIDRSREMFEKRISAEVRESQDYFQDELVRVLADGDPGLLGM
jgi:hypothetical protein